MHLSLYRLKFYCKTMDELLDTALSNHGQLDSRTPCSLTIGLLTTALLNHWTIWNSTVWPLDSWTKHSPTICKLNTGGQPSASFTQHSLTIGVLDTALSNHWTVWHSIIWHMNIRPLDWTVEKSTVQPLDCWTLSSHAIGQLDTA